jgi:hypothetical protein
MVYQYGDVVSEPMGVAAIRVRFLEGSAFVDDFKSKIQMRFAMCRLVSSPMMSCHARGHVRTEKKVYISTGDARGNQGTSLYEDLIQVRSTW